MYVMNILTDLSRFIHNEGWDESFIQLLNDYEKLGPLPGILLPFIEAFLPFLPLVVFVLANSVAYGLVKGFLYSWLGTSLGSVVVFFIIRQFGDYRLLRMIRKNKQVKKVTTWVERHGFGPLFLLLCFPFSPSSVINVVAGLSNISKNQFVLAVLLGKSVMIFSLAYIGSSLLSFAKNPLKTVLVGVGILFFWLIGKVIERKLHQKSMHKENSELVEMTKGSDRI